MCAGLLLCNVNFLLYKVTFLKFFRLFILTTSAQGRMENERGCIGGRHMHLQFQLVSIKPFYEWTVCKYLQCYFTARFIFPYRFPECMYSGKQQVIMKCVVPELEVMRLHTPSTMLEEAYFSGSLPTTYKSLSLIFCRVMRSANCLALVTLFLLKCSAFFNNEICLLIHIIFEQIKLRN